LLGHQIKDLFAKPPNTRLLGGFIVFNASKHHSYRYSKPTQAFKHKQSRTTRINQRNCVLIDVLKQQIPSIKFPNSAFYSHKMAALE
jgi:hypothetical protein